MQPIKLRVYRDGRPRDLVSVTAGGTVITIDDSLLRIARTRHEMFDVVAAPNAIVEELRRGRLADLFTFTQLLPDITPLYEFPMEWQAISALPIKSYEHWHTHQIRTNVRKEIKKAGRRGVEIRVATFDAPFIEGITRIFN